LDFSPQNKVEYIMHDMDQIQEQGCDRKTRENADDTLPNNKINKK